MFFHYTTICCIDVMSECLTCEGPWCTCTPHDDGLERRSCGSWHKTEFALGETPYRKRPDKCTEPSNTETMLKIAVTACFCCIIYIYTYEYEYNLSHLSVSITHENWTVRHDRMRHTSPLMFCKKMRGPPFLEEKRAGPRLAPLGGHNIGRISREERRPDGHPK